MGFRSPNSTKHKSHPFRAKSTLLSRLQISATDPRHGHSLLWVTDGHTLSRLGHKRLKSFSAEEKSAGLRLHPSAST